MKNKTKFLTLMMVLILSLSSFGTYANEEESPRNKRAPMTLELFEMNIDARIVEYDLRIQNILLTKTQNYNERVLAANERFDFRYNAITNIAPDLLDQYVLTYEGHRTVHTLLFEENMDKHEAFHQDTMLELEVQKTQVLNDIEAQLITYKEAADQLRAYLSARHEEYKALKDAYQLEIEPLDAENQVNVERSKALNTELKTAIESGDADAAHTIIEEMLSLYDTHIDYDYAKLEILKTYYQD